MFGWLASLLSGGDIVDRPRSAPSDPWRNLGEPERMLQEGQEAGRRQFPPAPYPYGTQGRDRGGKYMGENYFPPGTRGSSSSGNTSGGSGGGGCSSG